MAVFEQVFVELNLRDASRDRSFAKEDFGFAEEDFRDASRRFGFVKEDFGFAKPNRSFASRRPGDASRRSNDGQELPPVPGIFCRSGRRGAWKEKPKRVEFHAPGPSPVPLRFLGSG